MIGIPGQISNLLKKPATEVVVKPSGRYTSVIFDAIIVVSALVASFLYRLYIEDKYSIAFPLLGFGAFLALSLLGNLFTKNFKRRMLVLLLESAALLTFFFDHYFPTLIVLIGTAFMSLLWGEILGRRELANNLSIRFFKTARGNLGRVVTGLILVCTILYLPRLDEKKIVIPETIFDNFFEGIAGLTRRIYPEINLAAPMSEVARMIAARQAANTPGFNELTEPKRKELINQITKEMLDNLRTNLNITAIGDQTPSELLYGVTTNFLNESKERFGSLFKTIFFIGLFAAARGIAVFFNILVTAFAWLIYQLLLAFNFVHLASETRSQETVEYS